MPTYEFDCTGCGQEYEKFLKISDDKNLTCEACNSPLKQVMRTANNFVIPGNCTYNGITKVSGGSSKGANEARMPINIIDEKPGGGYKVTRIGQKKDIDND